jgi:hypothetical protein
MDKSRLHDVATLTKVLDDPGESAHHKRQAARSLRKIYLTKDDKYIKKERFALIQAQIAGDAEEADKIGNRIYLYSMRTYGFA